MSRKKHPIPNRVEMMTASINLGGEPISLAPYATTGLVGMAVAPRGAGKTNAGLLIAEQLSEQGWVSVLVDPEQELELLYGEAVTGPEALRQRLIKRDKPIVVVAAETAAAFVPYGDVILSVADDERKPIFVLIDEGQVFSAPRSRKDGLGEASDIIGAFAEKGRKRCLDLMITALRYTGSLHRTMFANRNLMLVGTQEDPTVWSTLAPQFKSTGIEFKDLNALMPGEFMCLSRRGVEKLRMPMAQALKGVAPKAPRVKRVIPSTFAQWDRAMRAIPIDRLNALDEPIIELLSNVAGLSAQQRLAGARALDDERERRG
jgi:hypothetical protein